MHFEKERPRHKRHERASLGHLQICHIYYNQLIQTLGNIEWPLFGIVNLDVLILVSSAMVFSRRISACVAVTQALS